ncbi:MAG: transposase [Phycisphaeraceae bacterium]|nr:transposase [Phycisphaeraceae bacterium]
MYTDPLAYFITFRTYGSWLHGDSRGSVDRRHNQFDSPMIPQSKALAASDGDQLAHLAVVLTPPQREIVTAAIIGVCEHKKWRLLAVNVRTNHVHTVVSAVQRPEFVMNAFKAWATRRLLEAAEFEKGTRVWSRHGSTVYLFKEDKVTEKCQYVIEGQ